MASFKFVTVEIDKKTLADVKFLLAEVKNGAATALKRAADKTAVTARERIVRTVQSRLDLTYTRIKSDTSVFKSRPGTTSATAVIFKRQIPLIDFPNLSSIIGTSVSIRKEQGPKVLRHAFRATMKSGHVGIFERGRGKLGDSNAGNFPAGRLAIDEMFGPSIGNVFHHNDELAVYTEMVLLFQKRLIVQAELLLKRA